MSKYAVFFTLKGEAIARAMQQPSDRVAVVSKAVESAGGNLEAYYLMFGQYDGFAIVNLPDSRAAAASSLAVSSTGAFEHLETHELIEAEDVNPIRSRPRASPLSSPVSKGSRRAGDVGIGRLCRRRGWRIKQAPWAGSAGLTCRAIRGELAGPPVGSGCTQITYRSGSGTAPLPPTVRSCWPGQVGPSP
jgi:uncharacterized protein with GYD domain